MRRSSAGLRSVSLSPPQPTGSPRRRATRKTSCGGRRSSSAPAWLRPTSKPASKRRRSSAKYASRQYRPSGLSGSSFCNLDEPCREELLDLGHRGDEPLAFRHAEWIEERPGKLVAPQVELAALDSATLGETGDANPAVGLAALDRDEAGRLERAEKAAQVARVEAQARAQRTHVAPRPPDLPQHARLSERALEREIAVLERSDALRHQAVEAPDPGDCVVHSLMLVRDSSDHRLPRAEPRASRPRPTPSPAYGRRHTRPRSAPPRRR